MLLAVERVALLRRVEMFARTPTRVLAGLAHVLQEVEYAAGTVLMRAGATEDWLFVLVDGEVEVVKADRVLSLTAPTVVGEMAVLDPEPRSATVRAATAVTGFRLGKADFEEAVRRSPDIALGVIVELVRRLRRS
jgi:CRP-like cAMP-binding protein